MFAEIVHGEIIEECTRKSGQKAKTKFYLEHTQSSEVSQMHKISLKSKTPS